MLTKRVLQAVDGSIRHWLRDAVMPLELDHGIFFTHRPSGVFSAQRCALCQLFVLKQDHCHCCPLFRVEGVWCTSLGSTYKFISSVGAVTLDVVKRYIEEQKNK